MPSIGRVMKSVSSHENSGQDPLVTEFDNLHEFLRAHYEFRRKALRAWSFQRWAKKLGLSSSSLLVMAIRNERRISDDLAALLIRYFGFSEVEEAHFENLLRLSRAESSDALTVSVLKARVARGMVNRVGVIELEAKELQKMEWALVAALGEIVRLKDFREDPAWIQKRLRMAHGQDEIREYLESLLKWDILERAPDGVLLPSAGEINFADHQVKASYMDWYSDFVEMSRAAIREVPGKEQVMRGYTLAIRKENIETARKKIADLVLEFASLIEEKSAADDVYHLQVNFFPLTK